MSERVAPPRDPVPSGLSPPSPPSRPPLPAAWRITLDPGVRRFDGDRQLLGGSPLRLLRLTAAGAAVVGSLAAGEPVGTSRSRSALARRLLDGGFAHPVPDGLEAGGGAGGRERFDAARVTVIVPVHDDPAGLQATLRSLAGGDHDGVLRVLVVDDGSPLPLSDAWSPSGSVAPVDTSRIEVVAVRRPAPGGPAVARQVGLALAASELVAFVDAGVTVPTGWLTTLGAHLDDPTVVAVAPRVVSDPGASRLQRYEAAHSPLDLGSAPGRVAPRTRIAYVPTAVVLARCSAVVGCGGFDPGLRYGEDVDLTWRLVAAGGTVRYVPEVLAVHPARRSWPAWWRQRVGYGSAAAPLAARHPGDVAPLQVSGWSAAAWTALAAGHPLIGAAAAAGSTAMLPAKLSAMSQPVRRSVELAGAGHLAAGRWLARTVLRPYWPLALVAALVSRRARRAVLAAVVVPAVLDWRTLRPGLDPIRYVALRAGDDIAYGTGVWWGAWRQRSLAALEPDLSSWPGRRGAAGGEPGGSAAVDGGGRWRGVAGRAQAPSSQLGARSSR